LFGKLKCRLCGDKVRFVVRHLNEKHPETLSEKDVVKLKMKNIIAKYFSEEL
jgi:hypothetical protein